MAAARSLSFQVPHADIWCDTEDGVRLAGSMLGDFTPEAIVVVHGFLGSRSKAKGRMLAESLSKRYRVLTFDLRGHGQSGGACTGGALEHLDVDALVARARLLGHTKIITLGWSLGGIAVLRHAALLAGVDGVIAISTPSTWDNTSTAVRRMSWLFVNPIGRALARLLTGTRINLHRDMPDSPADVVQKIAPTPLLLVHGRDDHYFGPRSATRLRDAAGEPKELWMYEQFGHAEDGFTPELSVRLLGAIDKMAGRVFA